MTVCIEQSLSLAPVPLAALTGSPPPDAPIAAPANVTKDTDDFTQVGFTTEVPRARRKDNGEICV